MNCIILNALILILLFPGLIISSSNSITGTVNDALDGTPLSGANIEILETLLGAATDINGQFVVHNIPPGSYKLRVTYVGYKPVEKIVTITYAEKLSIQILLIQDTLEGESIIVTAIADANQALRRESPIAFTRLNRNELSDNYTTGDIPDLIQNIPGVWSTTAGIGEPEIRIRGFSSNQIRFVLNNIPMNDPEEHAVTWSDWSGLTDLTNSVEVQRGPGFSLFSPNAFGGTVHIFTRGTEKERFNSFRVSAGLYDRLGITSGSNAGKIIDPVSGAVSAPGRPVNYTYSARFNSGPMYGGRLNVSFFFDRKYGDSYIQGTNYNGNSLGLEAESILGGHTLNFTFLLSTQWHGQAFALQDIDLLETLGREYNRKNHEWQENFYTKPIFILNHEWRLPDNKFLSNNIFFTFGRGADQTCTNDLFNTETGEIGFQESTRGLDAFVFGLHAQYIYRNYGLLTTDFIPISPGGSGFAFMEVPFNPLIDYSDGVNFFADQHTHSYQNRKRRDHRQFGIISYLYHPVNENFQLVYGMDTRYWRGHREGEVRMLKVSGFDVYQPLWMPATKDVFLEKVQSSYDYDTDVFNLSPFGRFTWKGIRQLSIQGGLQLNYTRAGVIENPIALIDFGALTYFSEKKRTSADKESYGPSYGLTNDYMRQYVYLTPWLGGNVNLDESTSLFLRIAHAQKEPSISDWYDFSRGPLIQKSVYPEVEEAVDLVPESITGIEFGVNYWTETFSLAANYYHSLFENKIESVTDIDGRTKTQNAGRALFQGIELSQFWRYGKLDISSALTLSCNRWKKMNVREIFGSEAEHVTGKVVPFAPERIFTSTLGYDIHAGQNNRLRIELRLYFWDEYYGTYTNTYFKTKEVIIEGLHYQEVSEHKAKLPYFLEVGSSIRYLLQLDTFDFILRVDANNILNRKDNFIRAQYSIDYTRDDFQAGRYNWYVLQAPLFSIFFTIEIVMKDL